MKMNLLSMSRLGRTLLLATLAIVAPSALKAQSGTNFFNSTISTVNLGYASGGTGPVVGNSSASQRSWAIFALSGGVTITDPVGGSTLDPYSNAFDDVYGNIGLGGSGNLSMTSSSAYSRVYTTSNSQTTPAAGAGFYLGTPTADPGYLSNVASSVNSAYNAASTRPTDAGTGASQLMYGGSLLNSTSTPTTLSLTTFASITGVAGATYVLNLNDLILSGASAGLQLGGTNTTNYIINVTRFMTLSGGAKITLAGGLTEANVLFNVLDNSTQYDVTVGGGSEVHGILMARGRNVKETGGSKIYGEVIAKGVSLSGASKVYNPFASP